MATPTLDDWVDSLWKLVQVPFRSRPVSMSAKRQLSQLADFYTVEMSEAIGTY